MEYERPPWEQRNDRQAAHHGAHGDLLYTTAHHTREEPRYTARKGTRNLFSSSIDPRSILKGAPPSSSQARPRAQQQEQHGHHHLAKTNTVVAAYLRRAPPADHDQGAASDEEHRRMLETAPTMVEDHGSRYGGYDPRGPDQQSSFLEHSRVPGSGATHLHSSCSSAPEELEAGGRENRHSWGKASTNISSPYHDVENFTAAGTGGGAALVPRQQGGGPPGGVPHTTNYGSAPWSWSPCGVAADASDHGEEGLGVLRRVGARPRWAAGGVKDLTVDAGVKHEHQFVQDVLLDAEGKAKFTFQVDTGKTKKNFRISIAPKKHS